MAEVWTLSGAPVLTNAMLRRLTNWRFIIIITYLLTASHNCNASGAMTELWYVGH